MSLVTLVVIVLVACLLWWALMKLMASFGLGDPVRGVVQVIFVVVVILWLVSALGYGVPGLRLR